MQDDKYNSHTKQTPWNQFEKLLQEISSRFISLPVAQIDDVIEDTQRRICETMDFDLSSLWQSLENDHYLMTLTHIHTPPNYTQTIDKLDASITFPWVYKQMQSGKILAYSNDQLVEEAAIDKESRIFYGVKSSVNLPLRAGGEALIGILSFDTTKQYRQFSDEEVNRLKLVAEVFTNALVRKHSEERLIESEKRLQLAAESAGIGLWELDLSTNMFWATRQALSIFGWKDNETINLDRFEKSIHPADLDHVRQAIVHSVSQRESLNVEYRIYKEDGPMRWILSSGYPHVNLSGEPERLLGVSIDINNRKSLEIEHSKEKERLASAVDIASLGFYEMVEAARIDFLDDRMREFLGITQDQDAISRDIWLDRIHPDDLAYVQGVIKEVLVEGADRFELFYRYKHPKRGLTWLHHLSRVLDRDSNGQAIRVIGVMQNVTGQKMAEEKLQKSEKILRDNQKDLQKLAGQLIAVKEEELRRLSRELHDDLTQRLAVLAINAGKLEIEMNGEDYSPAEYRLKIIHIKDELIQMSDDVHRISRQLHPAILDDLGLLRAIESECEAMKYREGLDVNFRQKDIPDIISNDISLCVFRVIQEALTNIVRYAGVKKCDVSLRTAQNTLHLEIQDDGQGFDPEIVRSNPGLGLSSMRERVQFARGHFSLVSQQHQGTTIRVQIPLNGETGETP